MPKGGRHRPEVVKDYTLRAPRPLAGLKKAAFTIRLSEILGLIGPNASIGQTGELTGTSRASAIAGFRPSRAHSRRPRFSSINAHTLSSESRNSASHRSWSGMRAMRCGSPMNVTPFDASAFFVASMFVTK